MQDCSICLQELLGRDPMVLPCGHVFCRSCVDSQFVRMQAHSDNMDSCPICRRPLFGEASELFDQAQVAVDCDTAVELYTLAIAAAQGYSTGPDGLNRLAASAQYNIGVAHESAGDMQNALSAYMTACAVHPGNSDSWCNVGTMYYNLGDPQQALDAWARALEINPNDQVARGNVEATNRES